MNSRRVAITGVGILTALGIGREEFGDQLARGTPGLAELTLFDTASFPSILVGELPPFDVEDYVLAPKTYVDRAAEAALAAMWLAVDDSGLEHEGTDIHNAGLAFGTATGSQPTAEVFFEGFLEKGPRYAKPLLFPHAYSNTAVSMLAIEYRLKGPHLNFASGAAASATAILAGYDAIRSEKADLMFVGGVEVLSESLLRGCQLQGILSETAALGKGVAPYAHERDGCALGEAAVVLVLEDLRHAQKRDATIYAEITGTGFASEAAADAHHSSSSAPALTRAMRLAVGEATYEPEDINLILTSANGSRVLDQYETNALAAFYGDAAVPVTAIKSLTGETLGASGAVQCAAAVSCLEQKFAPLTVSAGQSTAEMPAKLIRERQTLTASDVVLATVYDTGGTALAFVLEQSPDDIGE